MGWKYIYAKGVPIEAQYLYKKGMEMVTTGNTENAVKYFRQALMIAPGYSKALFEMGACLENLGLHDEAEQRYDQAIRIDPGLKDIREKRL